MFLYLFRYILGEAGGSNVIEGSEINGRSNITKCFMMVMAKNLMLLNNIQVLYPNPAHSTEK